MALSETNYNVMKEQLRATVDACDEKLKNSTLTLEEREGKMVLSGCTGDVLLAIGSLYLGYTISGQAEELPILSNVLKQVKSEVSDGKLLLLFEKADEKALWN